MVHVVGARSGTLMRGGSTVLLLTALLGRGGLRGAILAVALLAGVTVMVGRLGTSIKMMIGVVTALVATTMTASVRILKIKEEIIETGHVDDCGLGGDHVVLDEVDGCAFDLTGRGPQFPEPEVPTPMAPAADMHIDK